MGAPHKKPEDKRTIPFNLKLNKAEDKALKRYEKALKMDRSKVLRLMLQKGDIDKAIALRMLEEITSLNEWLSRNTIEGLDTEAIRFDLTRGTRAIVNKYAD